MIPAYHFASATAVDGILRQGKILPGIYRLDPSIWQWDCDNRIRGLLEDVANQAVLRARHQGAEAAEEPMDETALSALHDLVASRADELDRWQKRRRIEARQTKTEFECFDFLARDLEHVFLAAHDWPWFASREVSGFVFDAEELVWHGAVVRPVDLAETYNTEIRKVLERSWDSSEAATEAFEAAFAGAKRRNELRGSEALRFLSQADPANWPEPPEVVWPGDLPIDMALSVWKNGERVQGQGPSMEGTGGSRCSATLREFGRRISEFMNSEEGYRLLPHPRATWTSGGCYILADALGSWLENAFPLVAVSGRGGFPVHVLLKVGDCYVDADGASTEEELVQRWRTQEMIEGARVGPFDPAQAGEIDCPTKPVQRLVAALRRRFGPGGAVAAHLGAG